MEHRERIGLTYVKGARSVALQAVGTQSG